MADDVELTCEGCGMRFTWTKKEQEEFEGEDPKDVGGLLEVERFCKSCRPKQDGQRS
jgi:ribosomal protein L33